jgi:hypothetical protein
MHYVDEERIEVSQRCEQEYVDSMNIKLLYLGSLVMGQKLHIAMLFISKISISALGNFLQRDIRESTDELR